MSRGALLFYEVFLEESYNVTLDHDYIVGIKLDSLQGPFRNLFAGILLQAVKDLVVGRSKQHRESAAEWLNSDNNHIASFRHVCDVLNLDVSKVREKIKTHIERKNAGLPGTIKMPYMGE